jgi:phosphohistidine swiveling domain-containing protein
VYTGCKSFSAIGAGVSVGVVVGVKVIVGMKVDVGSAVFEGAGITVGAEKGVLHPTTITKVIADTIVRTRDLAFILFPPI